MGKEKSRGLRRLIKATGYSIAGYKSAWKYEEAFRIECVLAIIMIPAGLCIGSTAVQRSLLVGSCFLVIIIELLNAAIEAVVDRIGPAYHELSGRSKDMGSAAVLTSLILTIIIWGLILWERFC
ncbi:MAG: diacylglycerol kinase [bacterium]